MENWKEITYLLASGQGLLLSFALLAQYRKKNKSSFFLGLALCIISLEILNAWGIQTQYHNEDFVIPFWLLQSYLILPPAIGFFVRANLEKDFVFSPRHLLFFLPALLEIIAESATRVYWMITGVSIRLLDYTPWWLVTEILPILGMVVVVIYFAHQLHRYIQEFRAAGLQPPRIHILKLGGLLAFFTSLTLLWALSTVVYFNIFFWVEILLSSFLFVLGYVGYIQPQFFEVPERLQKPALHAEYSDAKELARLEHLFHQKKLHRQPKLSLKALATELRLPSRYVSHLINTYHTQNFHQFVNTFRVNEVIEKMHDPNEQHKTLLALALESGFNSKSSFNLVFKQHTGSSPSSYLQKQQSE